MYSLNLRTKNADNESCCSNTLQPLFILLRKSVILSAFLRLAALNSLKEDMKSFSLPIAGLLSHRHKTAKMPYYAIGKNPHTQAVHHKSDHKQ